MSIILDLIESSDCTLYHDYRSGDLRDKSGNNNHGIGTNHSLSKDGLRPSYLNNSYINVENCTLFDSNKQGTIFLLVKNQQGNGSIFLDYVDSISGAYTRFGTNSTGAYYLLYDGANSRFSASTINLAMNKSHCVVFENNQLSKFYQNGITVGDASAVNTFTSFTSGNLIIGANASISLLNYSTIQAVFVTKTKLSATEISQLHTELSSLKWPSKPITNVSVNSLIDLNATGLVSAYDFKNGSLNDLKGSNNGTQVGSLDFVRNRFGSGIRGDGNGYWYFNAPDLSSGSFFESFWYTHQANTVNSYISNLYKSSTQSLSLSVVNSIIRIRNNIDAAAALIYTSSVLQSGQTYHITWGIDSSKVIRLWIDGVPAANDISATSNVTVLDVAGKYLLDSTSKGSISNVEIYNTDLNDSDVLAIYNRGKRIKSYFDRGLIASGKTFGTGSFIENSGLFVNSGSFKIDTDGTSKYLECVTSGLAYLPTSKLGINPKQAAFGTWNFTCSKSDASNLKLLFVADIIGSHTDTGQDGYLLLLGSNESINIWETVNGSATGKLSSGASAISFDTFYTYEITRNYEGEFYSYIDGSLISASTGSNPFTDTTATVGNYLIFDFNAGDKIILQSKNPDYNFFYSPLVIEPS